MSSGDQRDINAVFTPRRNDVNAKMYVDRADLEKALTNAVSRSTHLLLFGESGNGKSWLYKRVLEINKINYVVANCANASMKRSLVAEICSVALPSGTAIKTSYSEKKGAEVKAFGFGGNLGHEEKYDVKQPDPLYSAFEALYSSANGKTSVIVFDNLEQIFSSSELMAELASLIILLDDSRYAKLNVKFLIVGTPTGILDYFQKSPNMESVANRVTELPKVDCLSHSQVHQLVHKGFVLLLQARISATQVDDLASHIFNVTLGVAQRVHEYCETLAYLMRDRNWNYEATYLAQADKVWLMNGLRQSYSVVETHLNSKNTAIARKNQVIFSIGKVTSHQFDSSSIEGLINSHFPETVPNTNMGLGSILGELSKGETPLLVKNLKTNQYRVKDPRFVMCIRDSLNNPCRVESQVANFG